MEKIRLAVAVLRVVLVLLFAALLLLQVVVLPGWSADLAEELPELAALRWPVLTVSVLVLVCVQVVIVCTWKLVTMVEEDRIFSEASLRWVDGMVWAIGLAWTLVAGVLASLVVRGSDPGPMLVLSVVLLGGAVLGLLMVVMRVLLREATRLRTDMEDVI